MNPKRIKTALSILVVIAAITACGFPVASVATETPVPQATETVPISPTQSGPPTEIAIQHKLIPVNLPAERSNHAGDFNSSTTAKKKIVTAGDRFSNGNFERPFNANTMDQYFPDLDIIDTFVFQDDVWIYGSIVLKAPDASNSLAGKYALELDLNRDGKGDWLILASNPASTDWSVNGVQVYEDANKDVGNVTAMFTDKNATTGDGFETLVFDQGKGNDVDSAWARISPDDPNTVEIAVKRSVLGNPEKYLINMWAGSASMLNPALFDLNDHFTYEQAGSADPGFKIYYPIKQISEIDNSCRMAVGFKPTGKEPGLCTVFVPHEAGQPASQPQQPGQPPQPAQPLPPPPRCGCSCIPC